MQMKDLGSTGIVVSELCFGTLPMGPIQANLPLREGTDLLVEAMENGINFFDTAQLYKTYPYLKEALKQYGKDVVISSKSMAATYQDMEKALIEALEGIGRDFIDIFMMHGGRDTVDIFDKRKGAWDCLLEYKHRGYLRAVGVTTHDVIVTAAAAKKPDIDVVFPIINYKGLGIMSGTAQEMSAAIELTHAGGKGVFAMKVLGGGTLLDDLLDAIKFVRDMAAVDAIALGMIKSSELVLNLRIFNDESIENFREELKKVKINKAIRILPFCKGCGICAQTCPGGCITMVEGKPQIDHANCVLCGYCAAKCPQFNIRVK